MCGKKAYQMELNFYYTNLLVVYKRRKHYVLPKKQYYNRAKFLRVIFWNIVKM